MGFGLKRFFEELEALLSEALTMEDVEKIKKEVARWKQYANDCGHLRS